jgi:hypothetical protein
MSLFRPCFSAPASQFLLRWCGPLWRSIENTIECFSIERGQGVAIELTRRWKELSSYQELGREDFDAPGYRVTAVLKSDKLVSRFFLFQTSVLLRLRSHFDFGVLRDRFQDGISRIELPLGDRIAAQP